MVLDLSDVQDARPDLEDGEGAWRGRQDAVEWREVKLRSEDEEGRAKRRAYVFPRVPGAQLVSYPSRSVRTQPIYCRSLSICLVNT